MTTANGVSPSVGAGLVATSLITFTLLYAVLAVIEVNAAAQGHQGRPARRPAATIRRRGRRRPTSRLRVLGDCRGAHHCLVRPHRRPLDRLLHPRGLRLRSRHAAARPGQGRDGAPGHDQHHRPGLGRQRGLAAGRRRRHVRGVPGVVRDAVQRVLPAAAADPARADRARRRVRVPRQGPRTAQWRSRWDAAIVDRLVHPVAAVGRGLRQHPARRPDRRRQGVHRRVLQPAQPLRAARRPDHPVAVPHPRGDLHRAEDRRPDPASGPASWPSGSVWVPPSSRSCSCCGPS